MPGKQFSRFPTLNQVLFELCQSMAGLLEGRQRTAAIAFRLIQQPLIVALQPQECLGVSTDDFRQPPPGVGGDLTR